MCVFMWVCFQRNPFQDRDIVKDFLGSEVKKTSLKTITFQLFQRRPKMVSSLVKKQTKVVLLTKIY